MSGTQTHQADFAMIAPPLARVLQENPCVRLFIFGYLEIDDFQALHPFKERIRIQPLFHGNKCKIIFEIPILISLRLKSAIPFVKPKRIEIFRRRSVWISLGRFSNKLF
jgi:hypothetical protein